MLTELKKQEEFAFLKEVDSIALQQSLRDLDRGFVNFFQKRASHPTFKSKHNHFQSYRTVNQKDNIRIVGRYIKLPKLGYVKVRQSMEVGNIHHVTIEHTPSGKYFAVLNVEFEPEPRPNQGGTIGIDVGIKTFYSDSNGNTVANPKYLERSMRKLVREQRRLSRREKGSHNRDKQRIRVAKVHEKVTNQRNDFLQKQSTMLVCENQTICIEDLHVKGMIRNHKLAKSIADTWLDAYDAAYGQSYKEWKDYIYEISEPGNFDSLYRALQFRLFFLRGLPLRQSEPCRQCNLQRIQLRSRRPGDRASYRIYRRVR